MRTIILLTLLSLSLFSCSNPEQETGSENSNFIVSEITSSSLNLVSVPTIKNRLPSDIKNKAIYNLRVCLKDPAVNNPIADNSFDITIDGVSQEIITDTAGCSSLFVSLDIVVDSCEKVEIKELKIKGLGLYDGTSRVSLAFNSTAKTTSAFIDTRYGKIQGADNKNCQKSEIIVSNFSLHHQKDSKDLIFDVNMDIALKKFYRDNSFGLTQINGESQYEIEYFLLVRTENGLKVLDVIKSEPTLNELGLRDHLKFQVLSKSVSKYSEFILQYSIALKGQKLFEKKFYEIKAKNIFFEQALGMSQIGREMIDSSLEKLEEDSVSHESVDLTDLIILKQSVNSVDGKLQEKIKKYTLKTCFIDSFDGSSLIDHGYKEVLIVEEKLESVKIEKSQVKSDVNGCLIFDLLHIYNLFSSMSYEKSEVRLIVDQKSYTIPIALHGVKPLVDLRKSTINKEENISVEHELVVDNFTYGQVGNKENSYYVNRFVQMYFEKKFFLEFSPSILSRNKGQDIDLALGVNFGKLRIKYHYLIGKDLESSGDEVNLSGFDVISTSESVAQISKTGSVHTQFSLPLEVSDALYLSTKGYLVLEITPVDELSDLSPMTVALEFYGTSTKENTKSISKFLLPALDKSNLQDKESYLEKLMKKSFSHKTPKRSSDLFFDYLKSIPRLADLKRVNTIEALRQDDFISAKIDASDLRLIAKIESKIPKSGGLRDKLCNLIYPDLIEVISRRDCIADIDSHLKVSSGEHIEELVYLNLFEQRNKVASAIFEKSLEVNDGTLTRGYGYMASGGDRSGLTKGEHTGVSETISSNIFYDGPPGVLMLSAGISKSHEVFTNKDNSKFQMLMNRYSSELTPVKLSYNAIGLTFPANIRRCTLIEAKKKENRSVFLCDEKVLKKMITQKWFYIGESDARKNGVLTDGVKVGEKNYLKIIRGEEVFNQIWSKFKQEDSRALILEIDDEPLGERLLEYKRSETINLEFEINKDSNFPGLLK